MYFDIRNLIGAGAMSIVSGGFLLASLQYPLGSARQMGPGFFPMIVAGVGVGISLLLFLQALRPIGEPKEPIAWRPMLSIFGAIFVFGVGMATSGLIQAVVTAIIVSSFADRHSRLLGTILLSIGFAFASWVIFAWLLRLPFPIVRMPF